MPAAITRSPSWPVVSHPTLRLLLPGLGLSYLGDGLALVAVVVLAQQLTTSASPVGLLATSSLLHTWGSAGRYTLV